MDDHWKLKYPESINGAYKFLRIEGYNFIQLVYWHDTLIGHRFWTIFCQFKLKF